MRTPAIHDHVRLSNAIPSLWLRCGDVGVVRSVWHSSPQFYEVEFDKPGESTAIRALVRAEDLEILGDSAEVEPVAGVAS